MTDDKVGELLVQQFDSPETCEAGVYVFPQILQLYSLNFDFKISISRSQGVAVSSGVEIQHVSNQFCPQS